MYEVTTDPDRQLMTVKVHGFWGERTFNTYALETAKSAERLGQAGGFKFVLIDMSDFPIQGKAVAEMHARLLRAAQEGYGVKAAVVMRSALSRLQAMRVAKLTGNDMFDDADTALESLMNRAT